MLYCPNPSCTRNLRNTKKPFASDKSFSNHVQQSPECKPFVLDQTAVMAPSMQVPSNLASTHTTAHLFKKQRLRLNPTFTQQHPTNTTNTPSLEDQLMDDDEASLSHDNVAHQSQSLTDDSSVASKEASGLDESFDNNVFADTTESPPDESDYSCFTTSQQCVTSLMYLLDAMECPDYGFKAIMEWARQCFEAGFEFNPKSKTRSGNLIWMYDALHNAEQMLPHLEPIKLPDPLPNVTTMNVICYDFVPQLLPFCKTKK